MNIDKGQINVTEELFKIPIVKTLKTPISYRTNEQGFFLQDKAERTFQFVPPDVAKRYDLLGEDLSPEWVGESGGFRLYETTGDLSLRECFSKKAFEESHDSMGEILGRALKNLHNSDSFGTDTWGKDFQADIDYLLYQHGLVKMKNDRAYLLTDFIAGNRHILNRAFRGNVLFSVSVDRLMVSKNGCLYISDVVHKRGGDPMYDLVFLNDTAILSLPFTQGFLRGYEKDRRLGLKEYRLIALYTAVLTLKRFSDAAVGKNTYRDVENAYGYFQEIIRHFDDFSCVVPTWAKGGGN